MSEYHRLTDQKYSEAEYLFQTIEMAKSDEEFDVELCPTPPLHTELELELMGNDPQSIYSWKLVKRRRALRRCTISLGGVGRGDSRNRLQASSCTIGTPPAPPSTPTSLTPTNTSLVTSSSALNVSAMASDDVTDHSGRLDSLLYILDYAPKYKKKLKEQQRTDAELAKLFNVVSLTATSNGTAASTSQCKEEPERGVSSTSRTIARRNAQTSKKLLKIQAKLREFVREPEEEDSVSAPEYDTEEEDTRFFRLGRIKPSRRFLLTKRERRFARFEHQERMEAMVDIFDEAMSFNDAS